MQAKEYDFTSFNEFINKVINPSEMCEQLTDLVFNYSWCINEKRWIVSRTISPRSICCLGSLRNLPNKTNTYPGYPSIGYPFKSTGEN